jgi:hypothetical protein
MIHNAGRAWREVKVRRIECQIFQRDPAQFSVLRGRNENRRDSLRVGVRAWRLHRDLLAEAVAIRESRIASQ